MKPKIWKIWIGENPIPDHFKQYTETWNKISGAEIVDVNMGNIKKILPNMLPMHWYINHFEENYTVLNHYVRYRIMSAKGGIYLDLDVEVIKDSEIWYDTYPTFFEETKGWINNHVMIGGGFKGSVFTNLYHATQYVYPLTDKKEINTGPGLVTSMLNEEYRVYGFRLLPPEYTTPWNWNEKPDRSRITENTIAVHHFTHSWKK